MSAPAPEKEAEASASHHERPLPAGRVKLAPRFVDCRVVHVAHPPTEAFRPISRIGGRTGWYYANWLWKVRGFIDRLAGGPGMQRGRPDRDALVPGDRIDFWRVGVCEPDRLLVLLADMKLPGAACLMFEVEKNQAGSQVRQTAIFEPNGLAGRLYWYGLYPVHRLVFAGMLRGIVRAMER